MHIDLDKIFNDYIATQQKSWSHDRSLTLGASEVFRCERWNWFDKIGRKQGVKPDEEPQRWGAMQRGNILEDHFVAPALQGHLPEPLGLLFAGQSNQRSLVSGRNSATPDGLITGIPEGPVRITAGNVTIEIPWVRSGCIGLEIKSIDPRANLTTEKAKHRGQSQVGLGLIREKTEYKPDHWLILYVDASFIDNITPFLIDFDPDVYESAKAKATRVFEATCASDMYPEGKLSGDCDHCTFKTACGEAVLSEYASAKKSADVEPEQLGDVEVLVRKYLELKSQFEPLEDEMKRVKQDVVEKLLEIQRSGIKTDRWRVTLAKMPGRSTLDVKALEATGLDLSQYQKRGQDYLQLTVKDLED
jgi:hypothetical protein